MRRPLSCLAAARAPLRPVYIARPHRRRRLFPGVERIDGYVKTTGLVHSTTPPRSGGLFGDGPRPASHGLWADNGAAAAPHPRRRHTPPRRPLRPQTTPPPYATPTPHLRPTPGSEAPLSATCIPAAPTSPGTCECRFPADWDSSSRVREPTSATSGDIRFTLVRPRVPGVESAATSSPDPARPAGRRCSLIGGARQPTHHHGGTGQVVTRSARHDRFGLDGVDVDF